MRENEGDPIASSVIKEIETETQQPFKGISICVSCFSSNQDDAAQWFRYAQQGKGVAIGFHVNGLREIMGSRHGEANYVRYGFDECLKGLDAAVRTLEQADKNGAPISRSMEDPLPRLATFVKEPSFESEKEFRLAIYGCGYGSYFFNYRPDTLIPYVILPVRLSCIAEIILGPLATSESHYALGLFLEQIYKGKIPEIEIKRSQSGLR